MMHVVVVAADVKNVTDPLSKVQPGLQSNDSAPVPLQAVHVRAKLLDLAAEVRESSKLSCYTIVREETHVWSDYFQK